jgi:hypothetical protein
MAGDFEMNKLNRSFGGYGLCLFWILVSLINLLFYWKSPNYPRFGLIWVLPLLAQVGYLYWGVTRPYVQINNDYLLFYLRPWKIVPMKLRDIRAVKGYSPYTKWLVLSFSSGSARDFFLFEMLDGEDLKIGPLGATEKTRGRIIEFLVRNNILFQGL